MTEVAGLARASWCRAGPEVRALQDGLKEQVFRVSYAERTELLCIQKTWISTQNPYHRYSLPTWEAQQNSPPRQPAQIIHRILGQFTKSANGRVNTPTTRP